MKTLGRVAFLAVLAAGMAMIAVAQNSATNKPAPPAFRTPLVRDLELVDQVKSLNSRVADLEAKNADLLKRVAALEAKLASARK